MSLKRVLIVNKSFPIAGLNVLKNKVTTEVVDYLDFEPESLSTIKDRIKGADAVIWNTKHKLSREILDLAGSQLKAISTMSSGMDHIDLEEVKKRGIQIGNTAKVTDNAVADIAVGVMIAAARRFKEGVHDLENGKLKYGVNWCLGQNIADSTVGIVGLGDIGQAIVRRLKGFDIARFIYVGRNDKPEAKTLGVERVDLDQLLRESDYIVLACPLTPETKHLINKESLGKMKKNSVIVNIARGEVIDQEALYAALKSEQIFAAGLDVSTPEPLPTDHPLLTLRNCYILPHMGSSTIGTRNAMASISANNVLSVLQGLPMKCPWVF